MNDTSAPSLHEIDNFIPISDRLATAGQPNAAQFADISQANYRTVVNLALPTSTNAIAQEADIVAAHQMNYVHIPVEWEAPTLADFVRFVQVLQAHPEQKIFVHCAKNMRVSAFIYLYRCIFTQTDPAIAQQSLYQIWTPNDTWQAFIEQVLMYYRDR